MQFPELSPSKRLERLQPPRSRVRMVLDTDAYNEIDDQFAIVHALLSPEDLSVEAIYAAPFHNERSSGPADGMEKSYDEILRLAERLPAVAIPPAFKGSTHYLAASQPAEQSAAALDLVARALASPPADPLYVVAIGAITNVAAALLLEPSILNQIVVVWLGGHARHWPDTREFNLKQDVLAARVVFDCGVPLVHVPCLGVASHLQTTTAEVEAYVRGRGAIGDYLADIFADYEADHFGRSTVLWDIATTAYLVDASWLPSTLVHSPIVTDQVTWSFDSSRHFIRGVYYVRRDPIYRDLFRKLAREGH